MNAGYAVYDIHEQPYVGDFVATIVSPFGAIRLACDGVQDGEIVQFFRTIDGTHHVVGAIPKNMPYMMVATHLMHYITEEEIFEQRLDTASRSRIYEKRWKEVSERDENNETRNSHSSDD